jgi:hypothetical protein
LDQSIYHTNSRMIQTSLTVVLLPSLHAAGASARERFTTALLADLLADRVLFHPVHGVEGRGAQLSAGRTAAPGPCA